MTSVFGSPTPRLWTPPLRELTPETSRGYEVVDFGRALGVDWMPWQEWTLVHGLETRADGQYRFRTVLVLVSRQNGKTTIAQVLSLWRMAQEKELVLGTSTNLETAREAFGMTVELAEDAMPDQVARVKWGALETSLKLRNGSRYVVRAANRRGGRGLSVDLVIADELREHRDWTGWGAMSATTTARPNPQVWCFSNAGDDGSVVLNHQRDAALARIEMPLDTSAISRSEMVSDTDTTFGLFEWSAEDGCELDDRDGWRASNPALGYTITEETLESLLASSPPAVFRTEHLCQRVVSMDSAIDLSVWRESADTGSLDGLRDRVALCLDVSLDMEHVTLVAAARTDDGRVRTEVVDAWESTSKARGELSEWLDKIQPREFGVFPNGPAAALAADFHGLPHVAISDVAAACMGFAEQVQARRILHSNDPLVASQLANTTRLWQGDGWRFARKGGVGHVDAVYATAGAVHLARTLPPPRAPLVVL